MEKKRTFLFSHDDIFRNKNIEDFISDRHKRCGYIYFLLSENHEILYIGKTKLRPEKRIHQHKDIPFTKYLIITVPFDKISTSEEYYIRKIIPPYNKQFTNINIKINEISIEKYIKIKEILNNE